MITGYYKIYTPEDATMQTEETNPNELRAGSGAVEGRPSAEGCTLDTAIDTDAGAPSGAHLASRFERDGYVVVPNVLSREECAELKQEGLRVLRTHAREGSSVFGPVSANSHVYYQLASDPRIVEVLRPLMPHGIMFMSDKFVWKSGKNRFPSPWHCDIAYWRNTRPKLSVWIPLDDATAQNGALKVIPGGHKREWQHGTGDVEVTNDEFTNIIADLPENPQGSLVVEMTAGSLLLFSDLLPHASTPNVAGLDRYAIISTYHAPAPDEEFDRTCPARHVILEGL